MTYVLKPGEASNVLLRSLQRFYAEKKLFDVSIMCNGRTLFGCHKLVLASCSSYFETLLSDTEGFAILNLDAVDAAYVGQLNTIVDFMYGHNIAIPRSGTVNEHLYEAARIFGATALIKSMDVQFSSSLAPAIRKSTAKKSKPDVQDGEKTAESTNQDDVVVVKPCGIGSMLLVNFQRFENAGKFIDAKICCHDRILFTCHKLVLASFSAYFETLLSTTQGSAILKLDAVDALYVDQLTNIINYMYGRETRVRPEQVDLLKDAAHVFGVQALEGGDLERMRQRGQRQNMTKFLSQKLDQLRNEDSSIRIAGPTNNGREVGTGLLKLKAGIGHGNLEVAKTGPSTTAPAATSSAVTEEILSQGRWSGAVESVTVIVPPEIKELKGNQQIASFIKNNRIYTDEDLASQNVLVSRSLCHSCGKAVKRHMASIRSHALKHVIPSSRKSIQHHNGAAAKCAECNETFPGVVALRSHWESTHGSDQDERGCFKCDFVFANLDSLNAHNAKVHRSENGDVQSTENVITAESNSTTRTTEENPTIRKLQCKVCGYVTPSLVDFFVHVNEKHHPNDFACFVCNRAFSDRQSLNMHYHEIHGLPMRLCLTCGKSFKTLPGFKNHVDTHGHSHQCSQCSFRTSTKKNLEIHVKKYHSPLHQENSISTKSPTEITSTTSEERRLPHQCCSCSASFLYECLLARHYQTKHLKIKPHKCAYCGYSTTEKAALQTHIRCLHTGETPFECEFCNFKTKTYSILNRHRKTHTGEKPHVCSACNMGFPEKRDLTSHYWKVHAKARPYKCSVCAIGFVRKDNLYQHERTKHSIAPSLTKK